MRVSYNWLRELVPLEWTPEELAERLTMLGFEVEEILLRPEGIEDVALEVAVPSNRGDALSMLGIAREVAALVGEAVRVPPFAVQEGEGSIEDFLRLEIEEPELCPRYSARLVRGVQVAASPRWLQERLIVCGMRPINNIVDITNYVMLEMGQPLHAFDYDLLQDATIIVRRARPGESIRTLDGVERGLLPHHLVIADAERPVAIAGVMGGANTEVNLRTRNVLIESAYFKPASIRRTARDLGLRTEASYRFERRVDPEGTLRAADRAAQWMAEWAGGQVVAGAADRYLKPEPPVRLFLRTARCNKVLGLSLSTQEIAALLGRLSLPAQEEGEGVAVEVPSYRGDLRLEEDLIEEVARIYGYNNIPETLPRGVAQGALPPEEHLERRVRFLLRAMGLSEVVTFSLLGAGDFLRARLSPEGALRVRNVLSEEYAYLRPSMLPSLLALVGRNYSHAHRVQDIWVFEIGKVYRNLQWEMTNEAVFQARERGEPSPVPAWEERRVAGALVGANWSSLWNWKREERGADFYTLKGVVEVLLQELGVEATFRRGQHPSFHPGRCAEVMVEGEVVGVLGEVRREVAQAYEVPERIYLFELSLDALAGRAGEERRYRPLPRFPAAARDIAFLTPQGVEAQALEATIRQAGGPWLEEVSLFDVYTGPPVPEGQRSLAFHLLFRHPQRTLTDEEVDEVIASIRRALEERFGVRWRER